MEQIRVSQDQWHIGTYTVLFMLTKALDVIELTAMAPNVKQLLNLSCDPSGLVTRAGPFRSACEIGAETPIRNWGCKALQMPLSVAWLLAFA